MNYIHSAPCTIADVSAASLAINASMFPTMEKEALIEALANTMTTSTPHQASKSQNWERLWEFLPEDVWESEGTAEFAAKAIGFLLRAGLRSPTEGTFKSMAVGLLLGGEDKATAMEYDVDRRQAAFNMVKTWFRTEVAPYKNVSSVVHELPQQPQLLLRCQAEELYGERAAPGKNRLAHVDFQTMLFNTRCRKSKTGHSAPAVTWQGIETLVSQVLNKQQTVASNVPFMQGFQMTQKAVANVPASPLVPWTQTPSPPRQLALMPHAGVVAQATPPPQQVHRTGCCKCANRPGRASCAAVRRYRPRL